MQSRGAFVDDTIHWPDSPGGLEPDLGSRGQGPGFLSGIIFFDFGSGVRGLRFRPERKTAKRPHLE